MTSNDLNKKQQINQATEKNENSECSLENLSSCNDGDVPDGGWGWMVVLGSFMVHVIADGVTYSFGALATEFVSHFDASRESVGWMASILVGMTFITGPFVSILCNKFGFRAVTMTGAIVSAVGFSAPFFYPEFWFLYLSSSVITGIGFGLVYLPSIVTVSIYFQEKRAFAIGLAVCGSGIGTFVFSPLIEYFNEKYCWQGSMLLIGGLILNCLACGAVYRPLRSEGQSISNISSTRSLSEKVNKFEKPSLTKSQCSEMDNIRLIKKSLNRDFTSVNNVRQTMQFEKDAKYFNSAPNIERIQHIHHQSHKKNVFKVSHPHLLISSQMSLQITQRQRKEDFSNEFIKRTLSKHSIQSKDLESKHSQDKFTSCINDVFDKDLLKNPIFLLFAISNFFTSVGFNAPFLYAKDRALEMEISNNYASFLISSIGIGNTLGRVIFGYLSTKSFVNRLQLYNGSLMLSGFVVIFSTFAVTYPLMILYTVAFGLLTGTYVTLTSVVLVDLLGIDKLNSSFGMTMVFQGAAVFIGPPLAGWIFDKTKSFDWSFGVCGGFLALSGIMLYFVYCSKEFRNKENGNIEKE